MAQTTSHNKKRYSLRILAMDAARIVCTPLLLLFRMKRITPDGAPYREKLAGGAIVAANHTSFVDPFLVGVTFWYRRMFFLVAEIVMKGKLRSLLLHGVGAIKVERSMADIEAIKQSVKVLKEGYLLTVFPQGGITKDENLETVKSGAVLMALQAGVPIVPIYLCPKKKWYHRRQTVVGETIYPAALCQRKIPSTADIQAITERLAAEMSRCAAYGKTQQTTRREEYEHV